MVCLVLSQLSLDDKFLSHTFGGDIVLLSVCKMKNRQTENNTRRVLSTHVMSCQHMSCLGKTRCVLVIHIVCN